MSEPTTPPTEDVLIDAALARDRARTPFDYIIVGSGAGGGPLAARLAMAGKCVLLVEAGGDPNLAPASKAFPHSEAGQVHQVPGYHAASTEDAEMSWMFSVRHYGSRARQDEDLKFNKVDRDPNAAPVVAPAQPPPLQAKYRDGYNDRKRGIFYPRSSGLGGCTAHHAMIMIAPNEKDWNYIANLTGDDSWQAPKMHTYFAKLESFHGLEMYRSFLARIAGWIVKVFRNVGLLLNPKAILDTGGHGFAGWQSTNFIDPTIIAQIEARDSNFFGVLIQTVLTVLKGDDKIRAWIKRVIFSWRILEIIDFNDLENRKSNPEGVFLIPIGTAGVDEKDEDGKLLKGSRAGVREFILKTQKNFSKQLIILDQAHVTRVIFEKGAKDGDPPRAVGVALIRGKHLYEASPLQQPPEDEEECYFTRDEVILSGGSFNTPQLLMLSGIGDVRELETANVAGPRNEQGEEVSPAIHLPGVGKNLQDRYEIPVISQLKSKFATLDSVSFIPGDPHDKALDIWKRKNEGLYTTNGGTLAITRRSSSVPKGDIEPDTFIFGLPAAFRGYYWNYSRELLSAKLGGTTSDGQLWTWVILKAYTDNNGGTVRLATNSPFDMPEVCFNSFDAAPDTKWKNDLAALREGIQFIRQVNAANPEFITELEPGTGLPSDSDRLDRWIMAQAWGHHACGTCRISSDSWKPQTGQLVDTMGVVDSHFRVHGVSQLRVVDASVFPKIPGYFILAPLLMVSEKAADTILADSAGYPLELETAEALKIRERRERARVPVEAPAPPRDEPIPVTPSPIDPSDNTGPEAPPSAEAVPDPRKLPPCTVGLALSGGGIRSATFCLGVIQAMAEKGKIRGIDYLSSVSGGGYIAGFLGQLFNQTATDDAPNGPQVDVAGQIEDVLKNIQSEEVRWLRTNANYITGTGESDVRKDLAILWRNLFAVHLVLEILILGILGGLAALATWGNWWVPVVPTVTSLPSLQELLLSPWWWLPPVLFVIGILAPSVGFWLTPRPGFRGPHPIFSIIAWIVLLLSLMFSLSLPGALPWAAGGFVVLVLAYLIQEIARWAPPGTIAGEDAGEFVRNRITRFMGVALFLFIGSIVWFLLDTLALSLAVHNHSEGAVGALMALGPLLPLLRWLAGSESEAIKRSKGDFTAGAIPALIAFPLTAFILLVVDTAAHAAYLQSTTVGLFMTGSALVFSFVISQAFAFLNLSSLHAAYAGRLCRTFLGAANPDRRGESLAPGNANVTAFHPKDDVAFADYHPEKKGGPLHLINVCVNETVDYASARDVRSRKGLPMCIGPAGVSVGYRYHGLWSSRKKAKLSMAEQIDDWMYPSQNDNTADEETTSDESAIRPLPVPGSFGGFHVFGRRDGGAAAVEPLTLSGWIAISGAAFTTGLGRRTTVSLSLLLGLVNLRLGYWWNSGIWAGERPGCYPPNLWQYIVRLPHYAFAMQATLVREFRALFPGPTRRLWYLSDGGHFEVSGCYELIRRRVSLILSIDGGEDPDYQFSDLSLLTRLARIDFSAEITWLNPGPPGNPNNLWTQYAAQEQPPDWIKQWLDPEGLGLRENIKQRGLTHSALGKITYDDGQIGWIVLLKSSLTGDEAVDVLQYPTQDLVFPNDVTYNQIFDETKWECYRSLGYHIGEKVFKGAKRP